MKYPELYFEGCKSRIVKLCNNIIYAKDTDNQEFYNILSGYLSEVLLICADLIELRLIEEKTDEVI